MTTENEGGGHDPFELSIFYLGEAHTVPVLVVWLFGFSQNLYNICENKFFIISPFVLMNTRSALEKKMFLFIFFIRYK